MFAPRKAIWCVRRRKFFYPIGTPTSRRGAGGERKAPCWHDKRQLCRRNSPLAGPDAPTPARGQGLQPYGALYCFEWRSEGVQGGERKAPPACSAERNLCRGSSPLAGPDAPTPARIGTCRPMGRSHFSFGSERKVCKRKPAARRLREKALYCPFLKEGVRNVARSTLGLPTWTFVRARAHSNPLSKRARLFPSAAYRRSAPPAVGGGQAYPLRVGMVSCWLADFGRSSASGLGGREP